MNARTLWAASLALAALAQAAPAPAAPAAKRGAARKPATAPAKLPGVLKEAVRLDIAPATATIDGPRASQHLVAMATLKDGTTHDVTDQAVFSVSNLKLAKVAGAIVRPVADGQVRVLAKLGPLASRPAEITVMNAAAPASVQFVNDVMPILTKAGCNMTACHGSPVGKGGFKLSLFGYEPELDYAAIAKQADGKRVNTGDPAKSLLVQKAAMQTPHAGGERIKAGGAEYQTLVAWVKEGAPGMGELVAHVREVKVLPEQPWLPSPKSRQRLVVTAELSDGSAVDVTDKAVFTSNDDAIADVDAQGLVTAKRSGETAVMVRYLGRVAVARVAVLPPWKLDPKVRLEKNNYIDALVQAKLQKLRVLPSDLCTDEEFIRRATLDTCGLIPTPEEIRTFAADTAPDKRAKLVDRLVDRPEFIDLWAMKWNDTLRNNPRLTRRGLGAYGKWIREQVASNRPFDQFTRDLITARGKNVEGQITQADLPPQLQGRPRVQELVASLNLAPFNPASNYFVVTRDPLDVTSATSQIFMGVRIECARCHNHPFEKWTQNDYYGLASFFAGLNVRGQNQVAFAVNMNSRAAGIRHPKTNELVEPKTLDDADLKVERGQDRRAALAEWITSPNNPFFAPASVNRIWGHYFGRGIVEPIDDFRVTNPASNPELLAALAKDFVEHKYDVKHMHRVILNSRTYQQSSKPNQFNREDTSNFARFYPRRLMAEQLYDSISQATGVFLPGAGGGGRGRRQMLGGKAAQAMRQALPDGPVTRVMQLSALPLGGGNRGVGDLGQFLNTFGKPRREVVCECERSSDGNMGQALALINGNEVNDKIASPFGRVQRLARENRPDADVVQELYMATVGRPADGKELADAAALFKSAKSRTEGIEDLMWGLLNSREFLFNH